MRHEAKRKTHSMRYSAAYPTGRELGEKWGSDGVESGGVESGGVGDFKLR